MDPRIQRISYSSLLTLHQCPRKFQLYKLQAQKEESDYSGVQSLTFAYGHLFGEGVQLSLQGFSEDEIIWKMFTAWSLDLFARDEKRNKDFWGALYAVLVFHNQIRHSDLLKDYTLLVYEGKPAVELSFIIHTPTGFRYRGFVDAVLQHNETGEILVLECKTTGGNVDPAQYKNSSQAIGYSIVLDHLVKDLSSYKVLYLPYSTKDQAFHPMEFEKSYLMRALWLQELLLDTQQIEAYDRIGVYPMHGESCYNYYRECEYFHCCTLSTEFISAPLYEEDIQKMREEDATYQIHVSLDTLIQAQLEK